MDSKQEICSVLGKKLIDYIFEVKGIGKIGNPYKLGKPYIFSEPYDRHRLQYHYREPHKFPEIYELHGIRKPYTFRELYELHQVYELHELRKKWNASYPMVNDRSATYRLVNEMVLTIEILPTLIEIALNESPDCFYLILLRIDSLLPDYHRIPCPPGFNEHLLRLHDKVKQYSFVPYLIELWDQLIEKARYFIPSEPVSLYKSFLKQLEVSPDAFLNYFLITLPNIVKDEQRVCPASMDRITEEGNKTCFAGATCSSDYLMTTHCCPR